MYYCGIKYIKDDVILNEPSADAPAARYQTIEENIKIFEEDEVEFISVPVPEFGDSDPANIVHDFNKVSGVLNCKKNAGSLIYVSCSLISIFANSI